MRTVDTGRHVAPILDSRGPDPHPPGADNEHRNVDLAIDGEHAVQWLIGDIDLGARDDVRDIGALAVADPRVTALVVDLSLVTFVDCSALGALVELKSFASTVDKRFALRGVPPAVSKVLILAKLDTAFGLAQHDAGRC